ncbi:beta-N-acetylhexosaminidase [Catalinimonas alkaloidigena]|uniref:serine hydrolase n=1 Tax=Catalinimonas alkaloidigena TaxID=1075417 RepID=UPI0024062883|nr:serine hydrolase [Catalinimonas alkaloidigena]MDF9800732.1 beta-N-acetylhexosaminidase [Catalinimonas alkaloidigena]
MLKKVFQHFLFHMTILGLTQLLAIQLLTAGTPGSRVPREQWIASVFDTLSLEQKIEQLFVFSLYENQDKEDIQRLLQLLNRRNIGGVYVQAENVSAQLNITQQLQHRAAFPLLIGMNARLGAGTSLDSAIRYPSFMTLGAIQNDAYLYDLGAEIAKQCRKLGVHVNMAPVLDIKGGKVQPAAGGDMMSDDFGQAFAKSLRYMQGMQDYGLIPCYKQYPLASPLAMASLGGRASSTNYQEGKLVAQLNFTREGNEISDKSFLLRNAIPESYLYEKYLELEGLAISKPLSGIQGDAAKVAVKTLQEGNDMLLAGAEIEQAINGIKTALAQGELLEEDIDRRVFKILNAKYLVGLDGQLVNTLSQPTKEKTVRWKSEAYMLKQYLYEEAITVIHNKESLIPVRVLDTTSFASLSINLDQEGASPFQEMLDNYAPFTHYYIENSKKNINYNSLYKEINQYGHVMVALYDHPSRKGPQVDRELLTFLKFLRKKSNVTIVAFTQPHHLTDLEEFPSLVCAYEDDPVAQEVAPQILFGAIGAKGRLPVNASKTLSAGIGVNTRGLARLGYAQPEAVGLDADTLLLIDSLAQWAIDEEATPGCQVLIARKGKIIWEKAYGYQTYDKKDPITPETIYDIASVSKVAGTMQAIMFLQERGTINLEEKISTYLPELKGTDKEHITVREVLLHRAGLRSFIPFWSMTKDRKGLNPDLYRFSPEEGYNMQVASGLYAVSSLRDSVWQWTIDSKLLRKRGRRNPSWKPEYNYRYSDLSFYILHRLVERMTNQPMDEFLYQNFYDPLGLRTLTYRPLREFPAERIAPTEEDKHFRDALIRGTVHDEGAALYGGVAGHAGLFSNAHDLAVLMQMNLQDGIYGGDRYFQTGTVGRFSIRQYNDSRRGLGWDKPEYIRDGGPTAPEASYASFGHLGFTGTAVWVDPKYDLVYIFLSNRIHPSARNTKLLTEGVRTKIQSVVYRAMEDYNGR